MVKACQSFAFDAGNHHYQATNSHRAEAIDSLEIKLSLVISVPCIGTSTAWTRPCLPYPTLLESGDVPTTQQSVLYATYLMNVLLRLISFS